MPPLSLTSRIAKSVPSSCESSTREVTPAREKSTLMVFGGEPLGERHVFWNFVSSRKERIEQAKADWAAGRFRRD